MNYLRNFFPLKLAMVSLIALYLILAISSSSASYYGPRYGKRESDMSRFQARSIGQRNNRGARFYPGSRYGGKRSYWQPTSFMPSDADIGSVDSLSVPNVPFDCILIPNLGVRCSRPEAAVSDWNTEDEVSAATEALPPQPLAEVLRHLPISPEDRQTPPIIIDMSKTFCKVLIQDLSHDNNNHT